MNFLINDKFSTGWSLIIRPDSLASVQHDNAFEKLCLALNFSYDAMLSRETTRFILGPLNGFSLGLSDFDGFEYRIEIEAIAEFKEFIAQLCKVNR